MNALCILLGHRPAPLGSRRRDGAWQNRCVICHLPLVYAERRWQAAEERMAEDEGH